MKRDIMIAIDPGNEQTGWVVYDVSEKVLIYKNKEVNSDMFKKLKKFSLENNVIKVGIEYPSSYGMPAGQTLFDTCTFCGILCQLFLNIDIKPELIFRKSVKMFLCGSVRANDSQVNARVVEYVGEDSTKKKANLFWLNEEVIENGGALYKNNDISAATAVLLYMTYCHDIPIQNEKEQERNKISKELRLYLM